MSHLVCSPAGSDFQFHAVEGDPHLFVRQSIEEELAVGIGWIVLRIMWRKKPACLELITAIEIVDALTAVHPTNSAFDLKLRC